MPAVTLHRGIGLFGIVLLGLALAACAPGGAPSPSEPSASRSSSPIPTTAAPTVPAPTAASSSRIQHVVIIVDENKPATNIIGNSAAPYLNGLASTYAKANDYSAIGHPSLPNYLAITSGTTAGIRSDCAPGGSCLVTSPNLTDELVKAGLSWRMYAESMPTPCASNNAGDYAVKHNPFMYYPSVTSSSAGCAQHVVPFTDLATDLANPSSLPAFSFISPNLCNDMHDCPIATGDAWLARNVPRILGSPAFTAQRSLLVVIFDEGDAANNVVACVFAGPAARREYTSSVPYTHYSLLRTVEQVWNLAPLTANDANARSMSDLLN